MSEPKGMLDTSVNGPEDLPGVFDADAWQQVDWRMHEERVRRLRRRIFKAVRDGDLARARNLQKLMLRSWSNTLVSVRQVTQRNAGRRTPGIDGQLALSSKDRAEMAVRVHRSISTWDPLPVRRAYVPKANGNAARSAFQSSPPAVIRRGCATGWTRSGRPGSNRSRMGFGRAVAAPTR